MVLSRRSSDPRLFLPPQKVLLDCAVHSTRFGQQQELYQKYEFKKFVDVLATHIQLRHLDVFIRVGCVEVIPSLLSLDLYTICGEAMTCLAPKFLEYLGQDLE